MPSLMGHILRRALRSLWENLYLNLVATGVIAASVLMLGVFLMVMYNLNAITHSWASDVHISAYFRADVPVERCFELKEQVAAMPGIESVRFVTEQEARAFLVQQLPETEPVLAELGDGVLPASLEITLAPSMAREQGIQEMVQALALPELDEVDYGQQWVERFNSFLALLRLLGLILGGLIALAAIFLVANTIHLVVYSRRTELETMRLVGATDDTIMAPFLIEGLAQGLAGSMLGLIGLVAVHRGVILRLQQALELNLAEDPLASLPLDYSASLLLVGCLLGVLGAWTAVYRFLAKAP
jgi:cell division transport system permease protein